MLYFLGVFTTAWEVTNSQKLYRIIRALISWKDSIILAAPQINQDAVRLMKELYGIDMEKKQYSKLISSIPEPDISISMGCDVGCPFIGRAFDDNWKLEDPTGKTDDDFRGVIQQIKKNILELKKKWLQYKFQFIKLFEKSFLKGLFNFVI